MSSWQANILKKYGVEGGASSPDIVSTVESHDPIQRKAVDNFRLAPKGVEARREAFGKRLEAPAPEITHAAEEEQTVADVAVPPSAEPELTYLGPDSKGAGGHADAPSVEAVEAEKPEGPVKVEDMVEIDQNGGVVRKEEEEVSGGVEKFDQKLPEKPAELNKKIAEQAVEKKIDPEENKRIIQSAFSNSLPQPPKVSVSEIRTVSEDRLPGSAVLQESDEPVSKSGEEVINLLDHQMKKNEKPTVVKQDKATEEVTPSQPNPLDTTANEVPVKVATPKPVEAEVNSQNSVPITNEKAPWENHVRARVINEYVNNKPAAKPAEQPPTEGRASTPDPIAKIYKKPEEAEALAPVPEKGEEIHIESVGAQASETQPSGAKVVRATDEQKADGVIGEIKPAVAQSATPEIQAATPAVAGKAEPKLSRFQRLFGFLNKKKDDEVSAQDVQAVESQMQGEAEATPEPLEIAA